MPRPASPFDPTDTWARRDGVVWRGFRTQVLLVDADEGYRLLDGAAALLWSVLDEPVSIRELTADVVAVQGADAREVEEGLRAAVDLLSEKGLIVRTGEAA